jgi:CheY-like chemotaxis protein
MTVSGSKSILVVEDDQDISFTIKMFLEGEGYQVLLAENGLAALELIQKYGMPHLILLDMKMPVMNGWQFAIEFLNRHDHRTSIVVMTAAADAEQRAKDVNAIGWIGKPFVLDDLLTIVKKYERH